MEMTESTAGPAPEASSPAPAADAVGALNLSGPRRLARFGYWLVPGVAGVLVVAPATAVGWSMLVQHRAITASDAWVLACLIPAALLILANWVRFEKPVGVPITAAEAPELFLLIEQLRVYLGAPALDGVYLSDDFGGRCIQRPSRGLLGGLRSDIVIGVPLLQSVSKAEAAVLIAHELAYLSDRQGKVAAEIHRARITWQQMLARQPRQPFYLRAPFALVTGAFARKFLTVTAQAERASVFSADRLACQIAGRAHTGTALQRLSIAEAFLSEYWQRISSEPVTSPEPNLKPYVEMADFLPRMTEWERASEILEAALARPDKADPAHPTLAERLDALGLIPELPPPVSQSAAGLLGASLPKVLEHFDAAWRDAAAPAWRRAYGKLKPETRRLLDLDAAAAAKPLDLAPAIERARLAYLAAGLEASRERYADLIEWHPQDARAALAAGLAMIDGGDVDGAECLRQALELAPRTDWTRANAEDWFAVGEALLGGGDDLGIDCLEQAIRIDPARTDLASFLVDRYLDRDPSAVHAA